MVCVYVAGTVREAERVEAALGSADIEYVVKIEPYVWHILGVFPTQHQGAAFYVAADAAGASRERLRAAGLGSGIVEAPAP